MNTNRIIKYVIPQTVKVRKYEVDIEKLKTLLKTHKIRCGLSNHDLAQKLNLPPTKVAHWFRNDKCFSVPDAKYWGELKKLLDIKTREFDASILTYEEKEGVYDMSNRIYDSRGIAPTVTVTSDIKILIVGE